MALFDDIPLADLLDHGKKLAGTVLVAGATFLFGRYWGRYRANREWDRKEFLNRVIVSLNIFDEGTLKIRTVMEQSLMDVFLNDIVIEKVVAAAKRTTLDNPMLPIPKADRWYLLNFVLNAVAEHFAAGQVKLDAGAPVIRVKYALFLTCELVGEERIRKVRAMLIKAELLENFPYMDALPTLENPWHVDRIKTLRIASQIYQTEPDQFLKLEVCV